MGPLITSRLTSEGQTMLPQPVRSALGVGPGDEIGYVIKDGRVLLTKVTRPERLLSARFEDPFAAFSEWHSSADDEAFAGL